MESTLIACSRRLKYSGQHIRQPDFSIALYLLETGVFSPIVKVSKVTRSVRKQTILLSAAVIQAEAGPKRGALILNYLGQQCTEHKLKNENKRK